MVAPERLVLSLAYLGALLGTLYCSLVLHSYVLTILSSVAQAAALMYYQVELLPGRRRAGAEDRAHHGRAHRQAPGVRVRQIARTRQAQVVPAGGGASSQG